MIMVLIPVRHAGFSRWGKPGKLRFSLIFIFIFITHGEFYSKRPARRQINIRLFTLFILPSFSHFCDFSVIARPPSWFTRIPYLCSLLHLLAHCLLPQQICTCSFGRVLAAFVIFVLSLGRHLGSHNYAFLHSITVNGPFLTIQTTLKSMPFHLAKFQVFYWFSYYRSAAILFS